MINSYGKYIIKEYMLATGIKLYTIDFSWLLYIIKYGLILIYITMS